VLSSNRTLQEELNKILNKEDETLDKEDEVDSGRS